MFSLEQAAIVRLGGPDNARAVGSAGLSSPPRPIQDIARDLQACRQSGWSGVVFVGGEPTMRPDLGRLLQMAARLGLSAGLATNGRMLAYPQVRRLLADAAVGYVRVGLHGSTAQVHDGLVQVPGAFEQVSQGLAALLQEAQPSMLVEPACTATPGHGPELARLVALVGSWPRRASLRIRLVWPLEGMDGASTPEVLAGLAEALKAAAAAGMSAVWEGLPPCLLADHAGSRDEVVRYGAVAYGPAEAGTAIAREEPGCRTHPWPCQECAHQGTCPGAPGWFLSAMGERALRPTRAVRSNSFNFEKVRDLTGIRIVAGDCALKDLPLPAGAVRAVVLDREGALSLYRTDTGDFTDSEIARTKTELEQLYLDQHEQGTLQEFLQAVRRVRHHPECLRCAERNGCCGAVVPSAEPAFEREERWITKELSRLRGRVLDVGCGDQLYRALMKELIESGKIEYHGVDPDAAALERMREAGVGGTLHACPIEQFEFEPGYFDYVLALRSFNHFHDLDRAFEVMARVLRVHGQFVLCDSIPYGLLRTPAQASYADHNAPVGHEHYRNWSSQQVVEFARRHPFRVDVHRPVSAQSCNQWIVKLMRVEHNPAGGAP